MIQITLCVSESALINHYYFYHNYGSA